MSIPHGTIPLTDTTLTETIKQLGKLQARVDVQDARIAELERRIADLETKGCPVIAENVPVQPVSTTTMDETVTSAKPQIVNTEPNRDMVSVRDFAEQIGIPYTILDGYTRRGVRGEMMELTEVPHLTRKGYTNKYFSSEQQRKALSLLRKHGEASRCLARG